MTGRRLPGSALPGGTDPRVVALGGGHGLAVSLQALRRVTDNLTAVVGVSDNGGSSGRLRDQFDIPPPGDLRMALAALCGDDAWGRTWSRVVQHRFGGDGDVQGHSLGNLLITALWEETGDIVAGLNWVGSLLGAHGRVLPVSTVPLEIFADVSGIDPDGGITEIRGQVQVATTEGQVLHVAIEPADPPVCAEAQAAIEEAEHIVLGPGSWYTSVMAPLLVPGLHSAIRRSDAHRSLVLNLSAKEGETHGFQPQTHLEVWRHHFPDLQLDTVFADSAAVPDIAGLRAAVESVGATLALHPLAALENGRPTDLHDPERLAAALGTLMGRGRIAPWR